MTGGDRRVDDVEALGPEEVLDLADMLMYDSELRRELQSSKECSIFLELPERRTVSPAMAKGSLDSTKQTPLRYLTTLTPMPDELTSFRRLFTSIERD